MDPFTDYQRIVHRTSDLIANMRRVYKEDTAIGAVLFELEKKYALIIADETYVTEVGE